MLLVLTLVVGCTAGKFERYAFTRVRMGAEARVVIWAKIPQAQVEAAADAAFARMAEIEVDTSDWLVDGPVAALRSAQAGVTVALPDDLAAVLRVSEPLVQMTDGAFDPTCGRVTMLWREARAHGTPPTQEAIDTAVAGSGWARLHFDAVAGTITPEGPVPWLDFGAIGKGFAADEALTVLQDYGLRHSMVELGGDLAFGDHPPGMLGWSVAAPGQARMVMERPGGMATSGSSEQHLDIGERRLSHVFDPRTGAAVEDRRSFTVQAATAAQADALGSAACVLGPEAIEQIRWPARMRVSVTSH